jgi:hypothetical protein
MVKDFEVVHTFSRLQVMHVFVHSAHVFTHYTSSTVKCRIPSQVLVPSLSRLLTLNSEGSCVPDSYHLTRPPDSSRNGHIFFIIHSIIVHTPNPLKFHGHCISLNLRHYTQLR